jgi:glycine/D-amino acid oxidase-like deaminating enzyme
VTLPTADVVVIGGGIIGSAAAYYLAKAGFGVTLLERKGIASGASGACADALLLQTKAPGPKLAMARASIRLYRQLGEELGCDLELRNEGGMVTAADEAELHYVRGLAERFRREGIPIELLSGKAAQELQPALCSDLLASTYCPLDCHLNPLRVCVGYVDAAKRLGARVYVGTAVTAIDVQGGRVVGVLTPRGRIDTGIVVNAAGAWASHIARMVGRELAVIPRRGQILVTEAVRPMVRGRIIGARYLMSKLGGAPPSETNRSSYSSGMMFGQQASGNFIVGSTREYVGEDTSTTHDAITDLASQLVRLVPALANVQVVRVFSGLRPAPPDGAPIIKRVSEPEGFVVAAGHEGDGICLAPITGRLVAGIVSGRIEDDRQFELVADSP